MDIVNIVANLSFAATLAGTGVWCLYIINAVYNDSEKTRAGNAIRWATSILTLVVFSSLAIQTASLWSHDRFSKECHK